MYAEIQKKLDGGWADKVVLSMVPFRSPEGMETGVDDAVHPLQVDPRRTKAISGFNSLAVTNYWCGATGGGLGAFTLPQNLGWCCAAAICARPGIKVLRATGER